MSAEYSNITIFVDESPNGMYNVSVLGYYSDYLDDEREPNSDFPSEEFEYEEDALGYAHDEAWAYVEEGEADTATVLLDGDEKFYFSSPATKARVAAKVKLARKLKAARKKAAKKKAAKRRSRR